MAHMCEFVISACLVQCDAVVNTQLMEYGQYEVRLK